MTYSQLLDWLKPQGIGQIARLTRDGYDLGLIGRYSEAIYPFRFSSHPVLLDDGLNTEVDEEEVLAIQRRFGIEDLPRPKSN